MIAFPCAKINLGLYIIGKRKDNYHNIKSVFYPIPFYDVIEIKESTIYKLLNYGLQVPDNQEINLITKTYNLLKRKFNIPPVEIALLKNIPLGSGLGGGSSDASATLLLLNKYFELKLEKKVLCEYAKILGADCPFFIQDEPFTPALVTGIGEKIKHLPHFLKNKYIVIATSNEHSSTVEAFSCISNHSDDIDLENIVLGNENLWKKNLRNDFEPIIFNKLSVLEIIKSSFYTSGAYYASLTGTGTCIYGLFNEKPDIEVIHGVHLKTFQL